MEYFATGRVLSGVGGRFKVRLFAVEDTPLAGQTITAKGRKALHRDLDLLAGDLVRVRYDDTSFTRAEGGIEAENNGRGNVIEEVLPRRSALIRPPLANLDLLFAVVAAAKPAPIPETLDKLLAIAEFHKIEPVVVITKCDLDAARADELAAIYQKAGFSVFLLGTDAARDFSALENFVKNDIRGKIAAVAGASGVGKSTLLNRLFPARNLATDDLSRRIERGKNTTRHVELYPVDDAPDTPYIADTPGFTLLDFERFDFFTKDDLVYTFREFASYLGKCRYTKCSHTKEEDCAILEAVQNGAIPPSRHASYRALYDVLKKKKEW